jgi:hypothetical protein
VSSPRDADPRLSNILNAGNLVKRSPGFRPPKLDIIPFEKQCRAIFNLTMVKMRRDTEQVGRRYEPVTEVHPNKVGTFFEPLPEQCSPKHKEQPKLKRNITAVESKKSIGRRRSESTHEP